MARVIYSKVKRPSHFRSPLKWSVVISIVSQLRLVPTLDHRFQNFRRTLDIALAVFATLGHENFLAHKRSLRFLVFPSLLLVASFLPVEQGRKLDSMMRFPETLAAWGELLIS